MFNCLFEKGIGVVMKFLLIKIKLYLKYNWLLLYMFVYLNEINII